MPFRNALLSSEGRLPTALGALKAEACAVHRHLIPVYRRRTRHGQEWRGGAASATLTRSYGAHSSPSGSCARPARAAGVKPGENPCAI